ncbi:MAG: DUF4426 domain-containing protein [Venatoribacter sp.]
MKLLNIVLTSLLLLASGFAFATERGEQKQTFGDYEVHYIGLTSNFLTPEVAKAYSIERSRTLGFLSISVLKKQPQGQLAVPVAAKVTGSIKNLLSQERGLDFREIKETGSVYYISTFRFDDEDMYNLRLQVKPEGQERSFDVKFSQRFYFENK